MDLPYLTTHETPHVIMVKKRSMKLYERFNVLLVIVCFIGFLLWKNVDEIQPVSLDQKDHHKCQPANKVVFLKTHKTGSETMAGILRKFAILNQKSTLLSKKVSGHLYHEGEHKHAPVNEKVKMLGYGVLGGYFYIFTSLLISLH